MWVTWNSGDYFFGTIFARHGAAAAAAQTAASDALLAQVVARAIE